MLLQSESSTEVDIDRIITERLDNNIERETLLRFSSLES